MELYNTCQKVIAIALEGTDSEADSILALAHAFAALSYGVCMTREDPIAALGEVKQTIDDRMKNLEESIRNDTIQSS